MSVGLLLITHGRVGAALLDAATTMLGVCPLAVESVSVGRDCDPDTTLDIARGHVNKLDQGQGVLVMTDIYGSTPSNIANRLFDDGKVAVVSGINLPMLIRVLNYPRLSLDELVEKAMSGARDGVLTCKAQQAFL